MNTITRRAEQAVLRQQSSRYAFGPAAIALRCVLQARLEDKAETLAARYTQDFGADPADGAALLRMIKATPVKHFVDGETVVEEGEPAHALYVVMGGTVHLDFEGRRIGTCREGDSFGEMALFAESTPGPGVVVEGGASLLCVGRRELAMLYRRAPDYKKVLRSLYREQLLNRLLPHESALGALGPNERHVLFGYFSVSHVSAGAEVVRAGAQANVLYVVASGEALRGKGEDAETIGVGDLIADREVLRRAIIGETVEAQTSMIMFALTWEAFVLVMEDFPHAQDLVMARLDAIQQAEADAESAEMLDSELLEDDDFENVSLDERLLGEDDLIDGFIKKLGATPEADTITDTRRGFPKPYIK